MLGATEDPSPDHPSKQPADQSFTQHPDGRPPIAPDRSHAAGQPSAQRLDDLLPEVYAELRALADRHMRSERINHTLQPSALVHEVYVRLRQGGGEFANRAHFFAAASEAIRRILIEHARRSRALKRGGQVLRVALDDVIGLSGREDVGLWELDEALQELERMDPRLGHVVSLRFFGGLSVEDVATTLGLSKRTVESDWTVAKAWLRRRLLNDEPAARPEKPSI